MNAGIGQLLPSDEGLNHQIVDTFGTVATPDLSWTEKIWTTIVRKDGSLQVDCGVGKYPNRNVIDGFGGVARGIEQLTVRASRELAPAPEEMSVGPISYEVVDPMKRVRFRLAENDVLPVRFDLMFERTFPAFFEDRHLDREGFRIVSDVIRYHQAGTVSGWIDVDGERIEVRPEEWYAFRDHSWGVRGNVGTRPDDLAPARMPSTFHFHWTPMLMENPDGSRYEVHYYFIQGGGVLRHHTGYINHPDGRQEPIVRVIPQVTYEEDTRFLKGGRIILLMASGEQRTVEIEAMEGRTGFHLLPALYGVFKGARHGMWQGPLKLDGERVEDCDTFSGGIGASWQLRDCPIRVREGKATGLGILESTISGDFPEFGLPEAREAGRA
jgi:hypothetical protein